MRKEKLSIVKGAFSIHKLGSHAELPKAVTASEFFLIANTDEGLSIVCDSTIMVGSLKSDRGWSCFKVQGLMFIQSVGILAGVASVLAQAGISIYAFCTYDTSYVLVHSQDLESAITALKGAQYQVV
jgi:uncharacterized protein